MLDREVIYTFVALAHAVAAAFAGYDTANWLATLGNDGVLSFTANAIPEPAAAALLGGAVSLAGVLLLRRRRT